MFGAIRPVIQFDVAGAAAPQGSKTRLAHGGSVESSKRVKPWRQRVTSRAEEVWRERPILSGPVALDVTFFYERGSSHFGTRGDLNATGRRRLYPYHQGDLDKLCRAIGDALTSVIILDDKLVVGLQARKVYMPQRGRAAFTAIAVYDLSPVAANA